MAKLLVHFRISGAAVVDVLARGFNSLVEGLPLHVAKFLWWRVPSAVTLIRVVLRGRVLGGKECGGSESKS
jgi:hypothetical protein